MPGAGWTSEGFEFVDLFRAALGADGGGQGAGRGPAEGGSAVAGEVCELARIHVHGGTVGTAGQGAVGRLAEVCDVVAVGAQGEVVTFEGLSVAGAEVDEQT